MPVKRIKSAKAAQMGETIERSLGIRPSKQLGWVIGVYRQVWRRGGCLWIRLASLLCNLIQNPKSPRASPSTIFRRRRFNVQTLNFAAELFIMRRALLG
jgi:hypothetical protein